MIALAYLLPPLSGLVVFLKGDARARPHGFQSVLFGCVTPGLLYLASAVGAGVTQAVFALTSAAWIGSILSGLAGRTPVLPLVARIVRDER